MLSQDDKCFACSKKFHRLATRQKVKTEDGSQYIYVGADCYKKIAKSKEVGYQPINGGPRLFLWNYCPVQDV